MRPQSVGVFLVVLIAAASSVAVRAGGPQTCGSLENAFQVKPCQAQTSRPWQVSFGVADLPAPLPVQRMTHQGHKASVVEGVPFRRHGASYDPSGSGFENAFVRGLNVIPPAVAKQPIDCPLLKPGDPALDRAMVRRAHGHVQHSGVIVAVAPCR